MGRRSTRSVAGALGASVAAVLLLTACQREAEELVEVPPRPVRAVTIEKADAGDVVVLSGRIAAEDETAVAFRIPGRLIERAVNVGDRVRRGQLLARLEQMNETNQLLAAQAAANAARAELVRARDELDRQKALIGEGFTTRAQVDRALATFRAAESQVKSADAQVRMANDLVGFTTLVAEHDGSVTARGAEPGEVVQGGQMILRIAREGGVDAVFEVPPQVLRAASRDLPVEVSLTEDPRVQASGRVREVSPQADPVTGTFTVRVGLANPPASMFLGSIVAGRIKLASDQLVSIPSSALMTSSGEPAIWIVDPASSTVALRAISILRHEPDSVVVGSGLEPGDVVVTAGVQALRPGQQVRLLD